MLINSYISYILSRINTIFNVPILLSFMHSLDLQKEKNYLSRFNAFFSSERLSITYKPVFLKSLIPISEYTQDTITLVGSQWIQIKDKTLMVDLNFIAIRYLQFYWELYFKFNLRQSHSPKDANINRILKKIKNDLNTSNTLSKIDKIEKITMTSGIKNYTIRV